MGLLMPSYACRHAHICMQVYVIASDPGPRQSQSYQMFEWCTELFPLLAPSSAVPALPTVRLFCPFPRCSSSMLCLLDLCPWPFCFFHLEDSYYLRTLGKPMCHSRTSYVKNNHKSKKQIIFLCIPFTISPDRPMNL